ncbi:MAG TPA: pilus assembly protein PilP, partial [Vicinamibacterales bacterium]|nr:pilus assembly protein PilP [Vicinamibacterales bacterium]
PVTSTAAAATTAVKPAAPAAAAPAAAAPATAVPAPPADPAKPATAPALKPVDNYTYSADGRRDPFQNLLARGQEKGQPKNVRAGLAGISVDEVSVRGVMQSRGGYVAIVQGTDNKTYLARPSDHLQDGTIRTINAQGLVILQEVTDPLSPVKQKEVRKGLRASDEGK